MHDRYQLLLAEGAKSDGDFIVGELAKAGLNVDFQRVSTIAHMELALASKPWDFIIYGDHLPGLDWETALGLCKRQGLDIPFIMVSEVPDADPGLHRIKAGVHEHVLKRDLAHLPQAIRREMRSAQERRIREHAETAARLLGAQLGPSQVAVIGVTSDGSVVSWNTGAERMFGYSASEMIGCSISADLLGEAVRMLRCSAEGEQGKCVETICRRKDALPIRVRIVPCLIADATGRTIGASMVMQNLAEGEQWAELSLASFRGVGRPSAAVDRLSGES